MRRLRGLRDKQIISSASAVPRDDPDPRDGNSRRRETENPSEKEFLSPTGLFKPFLKIVHVLNGFFPISRKITSRITSEHVEAGGHIREVFLFSLIFLHGLSAILGFGNIFDRTVLLFARAGFALLIGFVVRVVFHNLFRPTDRPLAARYITGF